MSFPQNSGCAPARPNEPTPTTDEQFEAATLEAAATTVGKNPNKAPALAVKLGVGAGVSCSTAENPLDGTPVMHALRGECLPPPIASYEDWFPQIPAGAFDAGLARVLAEETYDSPDEYLPQLLDEIGKSYSYAQRLSMVVQGIKDGLSLQDVYYHARHNAACVFRAGWLMAAEFFDTEEMNRKALAKTTGKGSPDELFELLRVKLHPGAITPEAITSRGYWTEREFFEATRRVRAVDDHTFEADPAEIGVTPKGTIDELVALWRLRDSPEEAASIALPALWWDKDQVSEARAICADKGGAL